MGVFKPCSSGFCCQHQAPAPMQVGGRFWECHCTVRAEFRRAGMGAGQCLKAPRRSDTFLWDYPKLSLAARRAASAQPTGLSGVPVLLTVQAAPQPCLCPCGVKPDRGSGLRDTELFGAADTEPTLSAGTNINTRRLHELHGS